MRFGSLFAGIGGLDLGLERAGMECVWQVEIDDYCQRVLARHFPDAARFRDVRDCHGAGACPVADARCEYGDRRQNIQGRNGNANGQGLADRPQAKCPAECGSCLPPVGLLCGGFPCQPVSHAGKRRGDKDERWLWPEFLRIIREVRPRWVLAENVPGLLSVDSGRLFGGILRDLAESGYSTEWDCIPAAAVGAPHRRDRVFIVAHANGGDAGGGARELQGTEPLDGQPPFILSDAGSRGGTPEARSDHEDVPYPPTLRRRRRADDEGAQEAGGDGLTAGGVADANGNDEYRGTGDVQVGRCWLQGNVEAFRQSSGDQWLTEPDVGRVAHGVPARVDRLRALGNAVVPQVAEYVGRMIMAQEVLC